MAAKVFFSGALVCVFFLSLSQPDHKLGTRLKELTKTAGNEAPVRVWVFFADKSGSSPDGTLSKRANLRRARNDHFFDEGDLPVSEAYIESCRDEGLQIHQESRWLNAVSGTIDLGGISRLTSLRFVSKVDLVASHRIEYPDLTEKRPGLGKGNDLYGASLGQLNQIAVPAVHDLGFAGQGVTIAVLDNGFRLLTHEAFDSMNIIATRDFVDNKDDVAPVNPSPAFGSHGVTTLAVIGGYKPGSLIGPAYKSDYILARTENDSSETSVEEDNWIAAMEWAEALGADIISSSVSYLDMDAGSERNYDWMWMTGDSTVITKAANLGVQRGLIIVNSAGNSGFNGTHNTLGGPADGDSVVAAGAVDNTGQRAFFSSVGPTTRGRIKPDVMAPGVSVVTASATNPVSYGTASGTSYSCPLTAGVCALILSANPGLSSAQVRYALRQTASLAASPDNLSGYGTVNAFAAVNYFGITGMPLPPDKVGLSQNFPNPFNGTTTIKYDQPVQGRVRLTVYNTLGHRVAVLVDRTQTAGRHTATWNGRSERGDAVASGVYFYKLDTPGSSITKKMLYLK